MVSKPYFMDVLVAVRDLLTVMELVGALGLRPGYYPPTSPCFLEHVPSTVLPHSTWARWCLVVQTQDQNQGNLWLALRVLWNGAWQHPMVQHTTLSIIGHAPLAGLLRHWSEAIQQRAAGVILNLCVGSGTTVDSRKAFWATSAPWDLCAILSSAVTQARRHAAMVWLCVRAHIVTHADFAWKYVWSHDVTECEMLIRLCAFVWLALAAHGGLRSMSPCRRCA
jgi:hypothetical protein